MTLSQKLKSIRKSFGLSQEQLAEMLEVSRQSFTKWESDYTIPDTKHLQKLSEIFGITADYFLNNGRELLALSLRKVLDKTKYKNKITSYPAILKEYYPEPYEIYNLARFKKMTKLEWVLD